MNEVTKIHLGRQQFTVAVGAYKALQEYLHAIKAHAGKEVAEEVELRMAELLADRGVAGDKVILDEDVKYLKEQLGEPDDFSDDTKEKDTHADKQAEDDGVKRLFRDPEHGMLAGVASGLAAYFKIDAIIVRLIFIAATLTGGWGIGIYIILWLLVPEAKSPSDRLQMQGKPITVDSIKKTVEEAVDRANFPAAAERGTQYVKRSGVYMSKGVEIIVRFILTIIGSILAVVAGLLLCVVISSTIYLMIHGGYVAGSNVFPIGTSEVGTLVVDAFAAAFAAMLLLMAGASMTTKRWRPAGWVTASLLGLFVVTAGAGTALTFNVVPTVHDRVTGLTHTQTIHVAQFNKLDLRGERTNYTFKKDSSYYVEFKYIANDKTPKATATVAKDGTLDVDTSKTVNQQFCNFACIYNDHNMHVTIHAPSLDGITIYGNDAAFEASEAFQQKSLNLAVYAGASINLDATVAQNIDVVHTHANSADAVTLTGIQASNGYGDSLSVTASALSTTHATNFTLHTNGVCTTDQDQYYIGTMPTKLVINDKTFTSLSDLHSVQNTQLSNAYNCVSIPGLDQNQ